MMPRAVRRRLTPQFSGILAVVTWAILVFSFLPIALMVRGSTGVAVATTWIFALACLAGLFTKWSDCPVCGRSAFRYPGDMPWWKRGGRLYDTWPARECSVCGYHLDRLEGANDRP